MVGETAGNSVATLSLLMWQINRDTGTRQDRRTDLEMDGLDSNRQADKLTDTLVGRQKQRESVSMVCYHHEGLGQDGSSPM